MSAKTQQWYAVTFRAPAEMTVWVEAENATEAKTLAESGDYDDASPIEFLKGPRYTLKAKPDLGYKPPEWWERDV